MSGEHPEFDRLIRDIAERPIDYGKLAAREAVRTDPWRWYCRLCGQRGECPEKQERDEAAMAHTRQCPNGPPHELLGWAEAGRLVHVWTYGVAPWESAAEGAL